MANWWKSKERKEQDALAEQSRQLAESLSGSLLAEFLDYVKRKQDIYRVRLWVDSKEPGKFSFHCKFDDEKEYQLNLTSIVAAQTIENPEVLILRLYDHKRLNFINSEFQRMEALREEIKQMKHQVVHARYEQPRTPLLADMREMERNLIAKTKEHKDYMRKVWVHAPYTAERLHAIYRAFLRERKLSPTDPVEVDLVDILEDMELSEETRQKARKMLNEYREKQRKEMERNVQMKEEAAHLVFSTIKAHYLEGGDQDGILAKK